MGNIPFMALPFIFLPTGLLIGVIAFKKDFVWLKKGFSVLFDSAFYALLFTLGMSLTLDKEVRNSIGQIGIISFLLFLFATGGSILFVYIFSLFGKIKKEVDVNSKKKNGNLDVSVSSSNEWKTVLIIVTVLIIGGIFGFFNIFSIGSRLEPLLDDLVSIILVLLYLAAGFSAGENFHIFTQITQIKKDIIKILALPFIAYIGSFIGGAAYSWIFNKPLVSTVLPATGMGYYSVTSAFCFQTLGAMEGSVAFLVNVFREIFTIATVPILAKVNYLFPTAAGGATTMDTSLAPIIKVQGIGIIVISLVSGIILTFVVPVMLPLLYQLFK